MNSGVGYLLRECRTAEADDEKMVAPTAIGLARAGRISFIQRIIHFNRQPLI